MLYDIEKRVEAEFDWSFCLSINATAGEDWDYKPLCLC
jgi:hypothetical protein